MTLTVQEFIEHHGVKGMKWGVRRRRGTASRDTQRTVFEKSPKRLTDAELKKRIERMDMEKRYNELNSRRVSKGEQLASDILTNSGRTVATTLATGAGLLIARQALKKKIGTEAAAFVTRRK